MPPRLKIAIWHNLPSGGGKRALYHHVKGLLERGHHLESWCPPSADQKYLPLAELIREHVVPLDSAVGHGPGLLKRLRLRIEPILPRVEAMEKHCQECARQIDRAGFDLLFANSCLQVATPSIGRFTALPPALYLQEPFRPLYEARPTPPWAAAENAEPSRLTPARVKKWIQERCSVPARRIQIREEVRNAKAYRRVLVNSLFSRESLLRAYGVDSRVCYLGVDAAKFSWSAAPRKRQIISLGLLYYGKGADRAIRAVAAIPREKRPALLWIGNGSDPKYRVSVEALAREKGVDFHFKEKVTDSELVEALHESYAMIYLPRLEPFGFAPLEANCCGLPVVAIAEGGIRETIQDGINGFLVQNDSPEELAAALLKLLDHPDLADEMRARARKEAAEKWNVAGATLRLEKELLGMINESTP